MEFTGKVKRTVWSLNPVSRTFTEVDLPNPESQTGSPARPGMYVHATTSSGRMLTLPASAVITEGRQH